MKRDIKDRWVAALRSKKFKQARGALRRNGWGEGESFCCLGVLCELAREEGVVERARDGYVDPFNEYDYASGVLPGAVKRWAGIDTQKGYFGNDGYNRKSLAKINDDGNDFDVIANLIEQNYTRL